MLECRRRQLSKDFLILFHMKRHIESLRIMLSDTDGNFRDEIFNAYQLDSIKSNLRSALRDLTEVYIKSLEKYLNSATDFKNQENRGDKLLL